MYDRFNIPQILHEPLYDEQDVLREIHEKYPDDKGHTKLI